MKEHKKTTGHLLRKFFRWPVVFLRSIISASFLSFFLLWRSLSEMKLYRNFFPICKGRSCVVTASQGDQIQSLEVVPHSRYVEQGKLRSQACFALYSQAQVTIAQYSKMSLLEWYACCWVIWPISSWKLHEMMEYDVICPIALTQCLSSHGFPCNK